MDKKYIYVEISEKIKSDIFNNIIRKDKPLPSIRTLAGIYQVNTATIVHALDILRLQGIIYSNRTKGYFVSENILEIRSKLAKEEVLRFLKKMEIMGFKSCEILKFITKGM